jgi:hypothetical protein
MAVWLRLAVAVGLTLLGLDAGEALAAGAAYQVDTADVSEVGACKVESWASFAASHDFIGASAPACVFDLGRPVEVSSQFNRLRQSDEWASIATPKLKTNLIPTAVGSWGLAATAQSTYDLISGANLATAATLPATFRFSDVVRVNLNAGWLWDRVADKHYLTYGAGLDWRTPDNVWTLTGEVFGQTGNSAEDSGTVRPRFQLGLRWRPVDRFNIDIIYGRNLGGEQSNWITLANTIRFEAK